MKKMERYRQPLLIIIGVVIGLSGCSEKKTLEGVYSCNDGKEIVKFMITGESFEIKNKGNKLISLLKKKHLKNANSRLEKDLATSMKAKVVDNGNKNYTLELQMSYKMPGEKLTKQAQKLGSFIQNEDGSLTLNVSKRSATCVKD